MGCERKQGVIYTLPGLLTSPVPNQWGSAASGSGRFRVGTNILHTITRPPPDTLLLYLPIHTDLPTLNRPLPDASLPHWFGTGLVNNPGRVYITPCFLSHPTVYHQPLKMEPIQGSETSANYKLTPGKYPKEHFQ